MKVPGKDTKLGRVLRAMYCAGPMTSGAVRRKARLPVDTAITARIRELRDSYHCTIPPAIRVQQADDKAIYKYHLKRVPIWIRKELNKELKEQGSGVAA